MYSLALIIFVVSEKKAFEHFQAVERQLCESSLEMNKHAKLSEQTGQKQNVPHRSMRQNNLYIVNYIPFFVVSIIHRYCIDISTPYFLFVYNQYLIRKVLRYQRGNQKQ
jgi:hypothetical protein